MLLTEQSELCATIHGENRECIVMSVFTGGWDPLEETENLGTTVCLGG